MKNKLRITALLATICFSTTSIEQVKADIDGFNNFIGWELALGDNGTLPMVGENFVTITTGALQRRNIWFCEQQDITSFTASFTYEAEDPISIPLNAYGISFILQVAPEGKEVVGFDDLAPRVAFGQIAPSFGLTLELHGGGAFGGGPETRSGAYLNGNIGNGSLLDVSAFESDSITVTINYDGGQLIDVSYENSTSEFSSTFLLPDPIEEILGTQSAYVGFGGGTLPGNSAVDQTLSNFIYLENIEEVLLGDINLDGVVDLLDVAPFVELLTTDVFQAEADINQDGEVDLLDVAPFVNVLTG